MEMATSTDLRADQDTFFIQIPDEAEENPMANGFFFIDGQRKEMQVEATDDFDFYVHYEGKRYLFHSQSSMSMIFPGESMVVQ